MYRVSLKICLVWLTLIGCAYPQEPESLEAKPQAPPVSIGTQISGTVAEVHDGDTFDLEVKVDGKAAYYRIRLMGADAPEIRVKGRWLTQPGAECARDWLEDRVKGKGVIATVKDKSYDRYVCRVQYQSGTNIVDASESILKAGWAWADPRYAPKYLQAAEQEARKQKIGLWADIEAPWTWRKK